MASESLLKYFFDYFQKFPNNYPSLNMQHACPVIIDFCDASAKSRNLSKAVVDFKLSSGLPLSFFFRNGHDELVQYLTGNTNQPSEAIKYLEHFVVNIEKHTDCLKCLFDKKERESKGITKDCHLQLIAAHLFGPLAGYSNCTIDNKGLPGKFKKCPVCKQDISSESGNTSFGNGSVWHGFADLFVNKSIVKVAEVTDDSDEPIEKRRKYMYDDYDDDSDSGRSFESNSDFKVKRDCIGAKDISQGLAQTIVNAFCEVQKNVTL